VRVSEAATAGPGSVGPAVGVAWIGSLIVADIRVSLRSGTSP
jgi:hypothetical protein